MVKSKKTVIFFHGAMIGGLTNYIQGINELIPHEYNLLCYEIPNLEKLKYESNYPGITTISYVLGQMIRKHCCNGFQEIELSLVGHSLGCDYVSSLVQLWNTQKIWIDNPTKVKKDKILLIEPFCIHNQFTFQSRRMAFMCPERFPNMLWNIVIGNMYTQLAIKRSMPRSTLLWINPRNTSWNQWEKKHIVVSKSDKAVVASGIYNWASKYCVPDFKITEIPGNHGGWMMKKDLCKILVDKMQNEWN